MMGPISAIQSWFEKRLGLSRLVGPLMYKPLSGGARYQFSLGSVNLFLFVNQALTGIFLMMYYVNSPDHAWDAVNWIQHEASFGYFVRGMHYWGASAMVVSVLLHMVRVFVYGAYKKPREIMWVSGYAPAPARTGVRLHGVSPPLGPEIVLGDCRRDQHSRHDARRGLYRPPGPRRDRASAT